MIAYCTETITIVHEHELTSVVLLLLFFSLQSGTSAVVQVQIDYLPSTVGENLELHNATCPTGVPLTSCTTFQVQARSDNSWHAGKEEQVGENIVVTATVPIDSTSELHPVSAVRYGYSDWPVLTVYNNEKFPGVPFSIEIPLP